MSSQVLGQTIHAFFTEYLEFQKGLRLQSIRAYRDCMKMFLVFVADQERKEVVDLRIEDLSVDRVLAFLKYLETERGNSARTRNQRLAALRGFFRYVGGRVPSMLGEAQRVLSIPLKRTPRPGTRHLTHEEVKTLFSGLERDRSRRGRRDRALLLFLYNTGARVQEVADLRIGDLQLRTRAHVRLCGKGGKTRVCPIWEETASQIRLLLEQEETSNDPKAAVFPSSDGKPLSRFGIFKIVRRHTSFLDPPVSPHVFRHTTAAHMLEAGVELNVIRGWLGHVRLETTERYADITLTAKEKALHSCELPAGITVGFGAKPLWRDDDALLQWLEDL